LDKDEAIEASDEGERGRRGGFEHKEDFDLAMSPHFLDERPDGSSFSFDSVNNAVRYHRKQFDFLACATRHYVVAH